MEGTTRKRYYFSNRSAKANVRKSSRDSQSIYLLVKIVDGIQVFISCDGYTIGILLPMGYAYAVLVDMILSELRLDRSKESVSIQYEVDKNMAHVRITNDNSVIFYMELKRKDDKITTYPLHIEIVPKMQLYMEKVEHRVVFSDRGASSGESRATSGVNTGSFGDSQTLPEV
ncbi:putative serine/threonine-protein kinase [Forsythia ovata]|uniref:Serine/threonine-protein kinase n=1 Tax=Forsythia ovata TaxID=205694 RepID=A0ABD1P7A2_9LAMI